MQQYAVPQFIDVKERIFGPLNLAQFGYVAVGCVISYIFFNVFDFMIFVILSAPILLVSVFLAFFQYNGQPASKLTTLGIKLLLKPRIRVWRRESHPEKVQLATDSKEKAEKTDEVKETLNKSSLKQLAYILDTSGGISLEEMDKQAKEKDAENKPLTADDRQKKIRELLGK